MFDSFSLQLKPVKQRRFWSFSLDSFFCLFCQTESFTSCWFDFFFFEVRRKWMLASDEPPTHSHSFHKVKHGGFTHLWCISDTSKRTCCKKKKMQRIFHGSKHETCQIKAEAWVDLADIYCVHVLGFFSFWETLRGAHTVASALTTSRRSESK